MKTRILLLIAMMLQLTACGSGGGGSDGSTPSKEQSAEGNVCIFKGMNENQVVSFLNSLDQSWSKLTANKACTSETESYARFAAIFSYDIADKQNKEIVEKSLEKGSLEKAILEVFDYQNCQIRDMDREQINNLKQCKWSE